MLTNDHKIILRYIKQNTVEGVPSDINIYELENINCLSWEALIQAYNTLKKFNMITGNISKTSFLELTELGKIECDKDNSIKDTVKLSTPISEEEVIKFGFVFDGGNPVKWINVKTGLYKTASDIEIIGTAPMTPAQEAWLDGYKHKIVNWASYPRKEKKVSE